MSIHALVKDSGATPSERRERYGLLLAAIVAAFGVQGIASPGKYEQVIVSVLLGSTLLLALWAAEARTRVKQLALIVSLLVVAASVIEAASGTVEGAASRIANLLLVGLAPPAVILGVARSLRQRGEVTVEAVFGVLCLYLLLGMFFAFGYGVINRYDGPFFAGGAAPTVSNCLYYSFTTLTTVGYGDLVAASNLGHTLSMFEALLGQIYLVTIVSLIVGNLRRGPRGGSRGE
jgi:Ion channel